MATTQCLSLKEHPPLLLSKYLMGKHPLDLLGKQLQKDQILQQWYLKVTVTPCKGIMQRKFETSTEMMDMYRTLPHHTLLHSHEPVKILIVFECAAWYKVISLNFHQGPDLPNKLLPVLLKFREETITLNANNDHDKPPKHYHYQSTSLEKFL